MEMDLLNQQLHHAHKNAVGAELAARGLSEVGHPMLLTILQSSGVQDPQGQYQAQRDLAQLLHISPAAVATSLKSLEKGGYIHREPEPGDARRNRVLLTQKGVEAVENCQQAFEAVARRMLADFTQEEQAQLLAFRQRMLKNLWGQDAIPTQVKEEP